MSGILRILCGLVLIILAYVQHAGIRDRVAAGEPLLLFGKAVETSPQQLTLAFAAIGVIGLVLLGLGIASLMKARR